jgi:carboxyl-terminal processing protease
MTDGGSPLISKSKYAALLLSSVLVVYALIGGRYGASAQNGALPELDVFSQVFGRIQKDYVDEPSMKLAITGAIRGLLERVDPYAGYLSAKDVAFYKDFNPEKTPGIGVVLAKADGFPMILEAIPGGTAAKAGLKTFDAIEAIDGVATREMNLVQVYGYLSNPADKPVVLTVIGNNRTEPQQLTVGREVTKIPPVEGKLISEGKTGPTDIAYIRVPWIVAAKVNDVKKQIEDLTKKGATGVILDLRSTAAGKDTEGFALANLFVDSGTLGYKQGQKVPKQLFQADPKLAVTKSPLVVLIDGGTGGPAELAAAAILDSKRGRVVGSRTFGTGSVQTLMPLEDGTALLLSTAKYYSPSNKDIQATGVIPDTRSPAQSSRLDTNRPDALEAPATRDTKPPEEEQMEKAIEVLKEMRTGARRAA